MDIGITRAPNVKVLILLLVVATAVVGCNRSHDQTETDPREAYETYLASRIIPGTSMAEAEKVLAEEGFESVLITNMIWHDNGHRVLDPVTREIGPVLDATTKTVNVLLCTPTSKLKPNVDTNWAPIVMLSNSTVQIVTVGVPTPDPND